MEQLQQNLQAVQMQKQQVEAELSEIDRALEELKNTPEGEQIFKYAGSLLIKVTKEAITKDLQEKKEVSNTRTLVLASKRPGSKRA